MKMLTGEWETDVYCKNEIPSREITNGVTSFSSWSQFICDYKMGIKRIRGSLMATASF